MEGTSTTDFTIEQAKTLAAPTTEFLCKPSDNVNNIQFLRYKIRDMDSGITLVDIINDEEDSENAKIDDSVKEEDRMLRYQFGPDFLELHTIATELEFSVGDKGAKKLMVKFISSIGVLGTSDMTLI